jgi:cytochrome P450
MEPITSLSVDEIDLSDLEGFWTRPLAEREGAFLTLRRERPMAFFPEFEVPFIERGPGWWAVMRYDDIVEASRDPKRFCSGKGAVSIPDMPAPLREFYGSMIEMDDPRHARLRRIVSRAFTPGVVKRLEGYVEQVADEILDSVCERGECDMVTDIAAQLPLRVICELMGIPPSDYAYILERTNVILGFSDPEYVQGDELAVFQAIIQAGQDLANLVQELGADREKNPRDDVVSALVNAEIDGERLEREELASFFILLAVAGNETTRNAISWGVHALSVEAPDQKRRWMQNFEELADTAADEIVRWATPVIQMRRTVTCDTVLGGQELHEGDKVVLMYASGNRDESVFERPFELDLGRKDNRHVGFGGYGPHYCLGAHLARREIRIMFKKLFQRMPDLEVTGEPVRLRSIFINGVKHLPVAFEPSKPLGA